MNPLPPDEPQLEALLRRNAADELADNGFSLRVLAALPPRQPGILSRRLAFCALGAAAGAALAAHQGADWPDRAAIGNLLEGLFVQASGFLADPRATAALVLAGFAAFLAWRSGEKLSA